MAIRPKLIRAGYTTLDSIPRIQKGSGTRFFCPPLKGVDSKTQESVTRWIQMLHKFRAHLHALDIKDAQKQRDPGIEKLAGKRTSKLAHKFIVKRNKIRNQCTLLRGQAEEGVELYLDKVEEIIRACDSLTNMEDIWIPPGRPQGQGSHVPNNFQDDRRTRTMERQLEHGRHTDFPNLNRDIPGRDQGNGHRHFGRGGGGRHRISFHTEIID